MPSAITELVKWAISIIGPAAGDPRTAASVRTPLGQLADRSRWLKMLADRVWGAELAIIGRAGNQLEIMNHGLPSNTPVRVFATSGGSLPTPLAENTVYYVRVISANYIELSATSGPGPAITLTADGAGDQWIATVPDWISALVVSDASYGSGAFKDLVVWLAGAQTVSGAKVFNGQVTIGGALKVNYADRSRNRRAHYASDGTTTWSLPVQIAPGGTVDIVLSVPSGSSITAVTAYVNPEVHAALPANMPTLQILKVANNGTETTLSDPMPDLSLSAAAYSLDHTIVVSDMVEPVDKADYQYRARFVTESGGGADNLILSAMVTTTIVVEQDDAPCA